jgi:hypothetical protein
MRFGPAALTMAAFVASSCGAHAPSTRLRAAVWDGQSGRAYALRCDPAGGTAPHPQLICVALRRHPNLLVGGPGLDHPCPSSQAVRVNGTYRGYRIDATFSPCVSVPGQSGRGLRWDELLAGATGGEVVGDPFTSPRLSKAERIRRRARLARLPRLNKDEMHLRQVRAAELTKGTFHVSPGQKPNALALAYLRDLARGVGLPDGPYPGKAHVYSTMRRRAERVFGFATPRANSPVYVLVLSFDYRDYTGRRHANGGALYSILDAATLDGGDSGGLGPSSLRGLGPSIALPL